ncbi:hypothetical protein niasHT_009124 [Heterodera trifolii]|uniref:non-specific serine/threonine protein kinase n=1 Tax=Heterodera trifolii TaxID=157864 RepID=A0ABD2M8U7_9BILA
METLLDALVCLYDECCSSTLRKEKSIAEFVEYAKPIVARVKTLRLCRDDFEVLKVIGRGSFGEVAVVRLTNTDKIYAMKILNKWEMLKRAETACFKEERDVMVFGDRQWITNLHYAFQDEKNLYLIMDYYVGGDLLTLLSKFEEEHGHVPEHMAKFYVAEMILAIDSVHRLGYVHRDIKPDNVLLDITGHIKLGDFGSCLRRQPDGTVRATTAVGTPDYISPETLRAVEDGRGRYGAECDWWSLGICMYEMIFGETPFYAESLVDTYGKIMNHEEMFEFPEDIDISDEAKDLISRLICARETRLGKNGLADFRDHSFFADIDWEHIRSAEAPYKPEVSSPTDTSNFDSSVVANDFTPCETQPPKVTAPFTGLHLPFIGFTFTSGSAFSDATSLLQTIQVNSGGGAVGVIVPSPAVDSAGAKSATVQQQAQAAPVPAQEEDDEEREAPPREPQPPEATTPAAGPPAVPHQQQDQLVAQLKDEIQILRKRLEDEQNQRPTKQAGVEELEKKCKEVKEKNQQLILQKQDLQKEVEELLEKAQTQSREWKSALKQRDVALQDYEQTNAELADTRARLAKAEGALREQEQRTRQFEGKCDIYQVEMRAAMASRAETDARLAARDKELEEERAVRAALEAKLAKLLEEAMDDNNGTGGKAAKANDGIATSVDGATADAVAADDSEAAAAEAAAMAQRVLQLEEQRQRFQDTLQLEERRRNELADQLANVQRMLDEQQQCAQHQRNEHEQDKQSWTQQHKEQMISMEKLCSSRVKAMESECADVRAENEQLRAENNRLGQELQCQQRMSAQIQEIVQFVSDGKERQELLQDLTTRLAGELECFKRQQQQQQLSATTTATSTPPLLQYQQQLASGGNGRGGETAANSYANTPVSDSPLRTWGSRRMNKQAKYGRFEAQQQLDAEMRAKRQAQDELREAREQKDRLERELDECRRKLRQQQEEMERMNQENASLLRQQHWAMRNWAPQRAADGPAATLFDAGGGAPVTGPSSATAGGGIVVPGLLEMAQHQHRFNANLFNRSFSSSSNSAMPSSAAIASPPSITSTPTTAALAAASLRSPAATTYNNASSSLEEYDSSLLLYHSRSPAQMNQSFTTATVASPPPPQHHQQHQQQQFPFHPQFYENARFYTSYGTPPAPTTASSIFRPLPSSANPKSIQSLNSAFNGEGHHFVNASLRAPTKCVVCTSVLIGADRQGMFCQECHVACHIGCLNKVPKECPVPNDLRRSDGIDMMRGNGTAYQGAVKTPKNGGVKRGWRTTYVIVCDFKLYLYDCQTDGKHGKIVSIDPQIRQVLDMKDPDFHVSPATENDAIHASKSDLPKIFKVAFSQVHDFHTCVAFPSQPATNAASTVSLPSDQQQQMTATTATVDERSMMTISSRCSSGSQNSSSVSCNNGSGVPSSMAAMITTADQQQQNALISRQYALLMADTKEEADKWVIALTELRNLFYRSGLPRKDAFVVRELCDHAALAQLRSAQCAAMIDRGRFVLGLSDQGLISVELDKEVITPVGGETENKKRYVEQVEYDLEEQLLIALVGVGKERHVRLIPIAALDGRDLKWIKVAETRGCHLLCWGRGHSPSTAPHGAQPGQHYFACAILKSVLVFQINRKERRHKPLREMAMPGQPQCLKIAGGRLFVGYPSSFRVWDLLDNSQISLVNLEDQSLQFLNQSLHDAEMVIAVYGGHDEGDYDEAEQQQHQQQQMAKEYLLVFQKLGIYVDGQGRRSRAHEMMFPCRLSATGKFAFRRPFLLHFSEHQICVFHIHTAEWVQTVNLRSARPLNRSGLFTLCQMLDQPHLVVLGMRSPSDEEQQFLPSLVAEANRRQSGGPTDAGTVLPSQQLKRRRKFSMRNAKDEPKSRTDRRSQLPISGPSNFKHMVHMGPGNVVELQNLLDLNTAKSPSASPGGSAGNTAEKIRPHHNHPPTAQAAINRSTSSTTTNSSASAATTAPAPVGGGGAAARAVKHQQHHHQQQQQHHGHHHAHHQHYHHHHHATSSSSAGAAATRPMSAQSRGSDASAAANRSTATAATVIPHHQQPITDPNDPESDYYLEPINAQAFRAKQAQSAAAALLLQQHGVGSTPAPPTPPSVPPPKRPPPTSE